MIWNYRVIHDYDGEAHCYGIHEVFYGDDGAIDAFDSMPHDAFGESVDELRDNIAMMSQAFSRPVLEMADLSREGENATD